MKIKKGFVLRDVAGRSVVVATEAAAKKFRGMVMLNDTGRKFGQDCKKVWIRKRLSAVWLKIMKSVRKRLQQMFRN